MYYNIIFHIYYYKGFFICYGYQRYLIRLHSGGGNMFITVSYAVGLL